MRFQRIIEQMYHAPWNVTPSGWLALHELVRSRLLEGAARSEDFSAFVRQRPELSIDSRGIAHVHLTGTLGRHLTPIEESCGNTSYERFEAEVNQAVASGARGILVHADSPGGAASGNTETARALASVPLPRAVHVDELCASAAYAIAAGADRIFAAPSAQVGSIGTILPLIDTSGAWEKQGVKPAYITHTGGDLKDALWPPSFSEEHRAHLQQLVDDFFGQFRDHVTGHRDVSAEALRGQLFVADRAKAHRLVDVVGSESEAEAWLLSRS